MKAYGLARIGRDVELRRTPKGEAVISLSLGFKWGAKGDDGNRKTEWVDASLWGKQAEALAPYLKKGGLVSVTIDDLHIETYQGKNGEGKKLAGRVSGIELAGSSQNIKQESQPVPVQRRVPVAPRPDPEFEPDDIPFQHFDNYLTVFT